MTIALDTACSRRVLFIDLQEVESLEGAEQVVNTATKCPHNPILALGQLDEWDAMQARPWPGGVMYDPADKLFKMIYSGIGHIRQRNWQEGYAESADGINWVKPRVGRYEWLGCKDNNIVLGNTRGKQDSHSTKMRPMLDLAEPDPAKRFKAATKGAGPKRYKVMYSPDAKWWSDPVDVDPDHGLYGGHGIDPCQPLYDDQDPDPHRRYKWYGQLIQPTTDGRQHVRKIGLAYGPTLEDLTPSTLNPVLDTDTGPEDELHFCSVLPYEGHYLMLYEFGRYDEWFHALTGELRLAVSRDGERFRRLQPHRPIVARGAASEWDAGWIASSSQTIVHGDKIWIFYSGNGSEWKGWPAQNTPRKFTEDLGVPSSGIVYPSRAGLATLRLDGFVDVRSIDRLVPATVTTAPITVRDAQPSSLVVNVADPEPYRSWVTVEIVDAATGEPLPGYGADDCERVLSDGVRLPVRWREQRTLAGVEVERIQLRFRLYGRAKLYSFAFAPAA